MNIALLAIALGLSTAVATAAAGVVEGESGDHVRVEIRGTLRTGVMAIGAETTGTTIHANNVVWELDFGDNRELKDRAATLNRKSVLVTGTYEKRKGVEVKERHIVKVTTLKNAD
jgi:hypothetical protein